MDLWTIFTVSSKSMTLRICCKEIISLLPNPAQIYWISLCKISERFLELGTFPALKEEVKSWKMCSHLHMGPCCSRIWYRISSWSSARENGFDLNKLQWLDLVMQWPEVSQHQGLLAVGVKSLLSSLCLQLWAKGKESKHKREKIRKMEICYFLECLLFEECWYPHFWELSKLFCFSLWSMCLNSLAYSIWWSLYFSLDENAVLISINDNSTLFLSQFANCLFPFGKWIFSFYLKYLGGFKSCFKAHSSVTSKYLQVLSSCTLVSISR